MSEEHHTARSRMAGVGAAILLLAYSGLSAAGPSDPAVTGAPVAGSPPPAVAAPSEWPCVQRRIASISAGAVWAGPSLERAGDWDKDFEAAALAQKLASRRTAMEDVDGLLDAFVQTAGAERNVRLTRVFAGVLDLINTERDRVMLGIDRYARGQTRLAERVRLESDKLGDVTDSPDAAATKDVQDLESALKWDRRIFEERSRALTYVCETPVILEKRMFDIARRIQQRI